MPIIMLRLAPTSVTSKARPELCPVCGSTVLQRWGQSVRRVRDADGMMAPVSRFRCSNCGHTFRHYPPGIDGTSYSLRIRRFGAVAWMLGLSYRQVAQLLVDNKVAVSHTTIWREEQHLIQQASGFPDRKAMRFAIDREFVRKTSPRLGVVIAVDFGDGRAQVLGTIDSGAARDVAKWLKELVRDSGIEVELFSTSRLDSAHG